VDTPVRAKTHAEYDALSSALSGRLNWLRAGVLGANDGILSTAGLVLGVAGANPAPAVILTAGVAGLVSGALSMAVGEYVSVSTQRDTEKAAVYLEREELDAIPEQELDELTGLLQKKGLSRGLARQAAQELTRHDALAAHAEIELGIKPDELSNPWQAALASALMSIGTVKAVAIGDGEAAAAKKGSEMNDPMNEAGFIKNSAGGVLAGISTGQDLTARVYCKPIPSVSLPQQTVDQHGHARTLAIEGRHDICVIPRIIPVCEAMVCLVLADFLLISKAVRP